MALMKALILLTFSLRLSAADTHTLQYAFTAVKPGIHFPEFTSAGLLDGEQFDYYDSNISKVIPKTEWIEKNMGKDYWKGVTEYIKSIQETYIRVMDSKESERFQTSQVMSSCEFNDADNTSGGYFQAGYNGEDFFSLDLQNGAWITSTPLAVNITEKLDDTAFSAKYWKNYLEHDCLSWLKQYVVYGKTTLERKVRPEVSVFQKPSPSPEVVCHATGFFPKAVMITWRKDGEEVHEDVELRETLPNHDGSFQRRSILKVPAEELQKHTYTCVVQHSSLEEDLVLEVPKGGAPIGIIVGVVAALVALVAVVAGTVVWKKKKSGERRKEADVKYSENRFTLFNSEGTLD